MLIIDKIIKLGSITSTQDASKELAPLYPTDNLLLMATTQTSGRGQYNHKWHSAKGGLYFTLMLHPKKLGDMAKLSQKTGQALSKTLQDTFKIKTKVKLPNDVLALDGKIYKKIAGILIESETISINLNLLLIGIGVNINNTLPKGLMATSLKQIKKSVQNKDALLKNFLNNFTQEYILWQSSVN